MGPIKRLHVVIEEGKENFQFVLRKYAGKYQKEGLHVEILNPTQHPERGTFSAVVIARGK